MEDKVKDTILACANSPEMLRELQPRLFELVVAELFASFGWEVSITPPTRDGGYDILGVTTDRSGLQTSWLVECKRYNTDHKVTVETARQLIGVKSHIGIPNAVLVTTSSFTQIVHELSSARQDLNLVDFTALKKWVREYTPPIESTYTAERSFYSCFISHSSRDEDFAQKLAARLRDEGVRIWFAPEDIKAGEKIYDQVKEAILSFDRLLIVLSSESIKSAWVQTELAKALERERQEGRKVLFPISLIPVEVLKNWECVDSDSGIDMAREVRSYYIPDFSKWTDPDEFEKHLAEVIRALHEVNSNVTDNSDVFHLTQGLRASSISEREKAARELAKLGKDAVAAVPTLRKALKDPSLYVRNAAASALAAIGTEEALMGLNEFEGR